MKKNYRIVLVGNETLAAEAGQRLIERGHQVLAIITESEAIAAWAKRQDVPRRTIDEIIEGEDFDILFSLAYLRPLPLALIEKARLEAINFHDGPLPRYAGVYTTSWAILEGAREYGVRYHRMIEALDAGDIVAKRDFELDEEETALSLNTRAFTEALSLFDELLDRIEAGVDLCLERGRPPSRVYLKRERPHAVAIIDPSMGVEAVHRLSRALDFGDYPNPLTKPKFRVDGVFYSFDSIELLEAGGPSEPGAILDVRDDSVTLTLSDGLVRLRGVRALTPPARPLRRGARIVGLDREERRRFQEAHEECARYEESIVRELQSLEPPALPIITQSERKERAAAQARVDVPLVSEGEASEFIAAFAIALGRFSSAYRISLGFESDAQRRRAVSTAGLMMETLPMTLDVSRQKRVGGLLDELRSLLASPRLESAIPRDLFVRMPRLHRPELPVGVVIGEASTEGPPLQLLIRGNIAALRIDPAAVDRDDALSFSEAVDAVLRGLRARPQATIGELPLLTREDRERLLAGRIGARIELGDQTVSDLFEAAVDRDPQKRALIFQGEALSYIELERLADAIAAALIERQLPRNSVVGLSARRGPALVYGALGIMKAGHAYLPLDPDYPVERLEMMLEDSNAPLILVDEVGDGLFESLPLERIRLDRLPHTASRVQAQRRMDDLGYLIFTSGSTGRPKGVMVEQRNIVNFLRGMDDRVASGENAGAFLALTSLSFDISVLELFFCLTRGMTIVLASDEEKTLRHDIARKRLDIGLFYWGNYETVSEGYDHYRLLLEGVKIAERHQMSSVFIPERHFHEFGGAYPNPSVAAAAVAAITKNLEIRAGSCVLPLHHPLRVAEEWAMVDQLSHGRVGLAFASGWQPDDFVLRPENAPPKNKEALFRDLEIVRRLFRGERVKFPSPSGEEIAIRTMPRPVQSEIPIWITTAGNVETFIAAGRAGANLLTHLLGQTIEEVGEKIARYREALADSGYDPSRFRVTLMLHTFVARDREEARMAVEGPLKQYLRSAAGLIRNYAWAFPAFKRPAALDGASDIDLSALSEEELEAILDYAFHRYFDESGLFGSIDDCALQLDRIRGIDVDEVSCLVDFGIPEALVLESIERLGTVLKNERATASSGGLAEQIRRHNVRSIQGTPSTMRMLLTHHETREALRSVRYFYIGGEPLTGSLVAELEALTEGEARIENMYGPTETTVWSSTGRASAEDEIAPIGEPIANTRLLVLDEALEPVPPGMIGELYIGGEGVTRGYIGRDELTRAVFLNDPHHPGERIYRTGDRAKLRGDGTIDFIGRVDHQVKVRGFRIELGEIEKRAAELEGVKEAVAIVREERVGDPQIALYVEGSGPNLASEVREALMRSLPAYMVPSHVVEIDRWPLTPNEKIDRKALPAPHELATTKVEIVAPENDLERTIVALYASLFGRDEISALDHFFELGGHSLLAVEAHRRLKEKIDLPVTVIDIFRFPVIRDLAAHLGRATGKNAALEKTKERALARRRTMHPRRAPSSA